MNKKYLPALVVIFIGLLFLTVGVLTASDVETPDDLIIENEGYKADKKGGVKLNHKKHTDEYKVGCDDCHHEYEGDKNVWKEGDPVKKCSECHDPLKKEGEVKKLQNAFHKNCKTCHKTLVSEGKSESAPFKKCTKCHEKAS